LPWRLKSKDFVNMLQYLVPEFHNLPSLNLFPTARTGFGEMNTRHKTMLHKLRYSKLWIQKGFPYAK
jgi:hypothetical protein